MPPGARWAVLSRAITRSDRSTAPPPAAAASTAFKCNKCWLGKSGKASGSQIVGAAGSNFSWMVLCSEEQVATYYQPARGKLHHCEKPPRGPKARNPLNTKAPE